MAKNTTNDLQRARTLALGLLTDLEAMSIHGNALERLGDVLSDPNGNDFEAAIQQSYRQVISLPSRIDSTHKLIQTMQALGMLELKGGCDGT